MFKKALPLSLLGLAEALKVGILADPHMLDAYEPSSSSHHCGRGGTISKTAGPNAPLGRLGCDAPPELIEALMQTFKNKEGTPDFFTLNGDVIGHGISIKDPTEGTSTPEEIVVIKQRIRALHTKMQGYFKKFFPNTPVFITFGNNDSYNHDSAVFQADKKEFYTFIYNLWFKEFPGNQKFDTAENQKTFMDGGYFRADVTSTISVLSYNSMENSADQVVEQIGSERNNAFNWLDSQLGDSSKKFVLMSHIYAGARHKHSTKKGANDLWFVDDEAKYLSIFYKHKNNIAIEIGAHDHWEDVRVIEDPELGVYRNLIVGTGMSCKQGNMPGYSTMQLSSEGVPSNLELTSLDITAVYGQENPALSTVPVYSLKYSDFGITKLTPEAIVSGYATLAKKSFAEQEKFLSSKEGFEASDATLFNEGKALVAGWGLVNEAAGNAQGFFC